HRFRPTPPISAPGSACDGIAVSLLYESVDTRKQQSEERRCEHAPQCEREKADATAETAAHGLCRDAGLNDWQRVQRTRYEQDGCPRGPTDVLVGDIETLLDVDGSAELREAHDLRCLRGGDDDLTPLERERDHHGALLATRKVSTRLLDHLGRRGRALERGEKALLARAFARTLFEARGDHDRTALANDRRPREAEIRGGSRSLVPVCALRIANRRDNDVVLPRDPPGV